MKEPFTYNRTGCAVFPVVVVDFFAVAVVALILTVMYIYNYNYYYIITIGQCCVVINNYNYYSSQTKGYCTTKEHKKNERNSTARSGGDMSMEGLKRHAMECKGGDGELWGGGLKQ